MTIGHDEQISDEILFQILDIVGLRKDIDKLPQKWNTHINVENTALSGGQIQRLCLCRALLSHAPILILDEATSNLDITMEERILNYLFSIDKTILFISHHLNVAIKADDIILLDKGKVVAHNNHINLMTSNQLYQKIFN